MLAVHVAGGVVVEDEHQAGKPGQSGGTQMSEMGNAGHLDFDGNGYLALDLLGAAAWPLGDDLNVVVGYVRIGFDGQAAKRDDAPGGEYNRRRRASLPRFWSAKSTILRIIYWFPMSQVTRHPSQLADLKRCR